MNEKLVFFFDTSALAHSSRHRPPPQNIPSRTHDSDNSKSGAIRATIALQEGRSNNQRHEPFFRECRYDLQNSDGAPHTQNEEIFIICPPRKKKSSQYFADWHLLLAASDSSVGYCRWNAPWWLLLFFGTKSCVELRAEKKRGKGGRTTGGQLKTPKKSGCNSERSTNNDIRFFTTIHHNQNNESPMPPSIHLLRPSAPLFPLFPRRTTVDSTWNRISFY